MEKIFRNAPIMAKNDEVRRGLWDLARAHRMLDMEGQNDFAWGHASMRDPWDRGIWLKRANLGLEEVFENDFILLDFDGNVLGGDGVRHLEWPIHTETLRARPDFNFVLHTHAPWSVLFSACTGEILRPYSNEGCWFTVPPPHYMGTSDLIDTPELGRACAEVMGKSEGVFIRNHGVIVGGRTVKDMLLAAIFLEKACRVQLQLAMSGIKHTYPDAAEIDKKRKTIFPQRARDNCWDYMNRKLDRHEGKVGVDNGEFR
jgi:L-fuculose-phosphate aldolase